MAPKAKKKAATKQKKAEKKAATVLKRQSTLEQKRESLNKKLNTPAPKTQNKKKPRLKKQFNNFCKKITYYIRKRQNLRVPSQ